MTQEMYGATGRVGNKTYYRSNGKTIAREVVTPKNPKTHSLTPPRRGWRRFTDWQNAPSRIG